MWRTILLQIHFESLCNPPLFGHMSICQLERSTQPTNIYRSESDHIRRYMKTSSWLRWGSTPPLMVARSKPINHEEIMMICRFKLSNQSNLFKTGSGTQRYVRYYSFDVVRTASSYLVVSIKGWNASDKDQIEKFISIITIKF